MTTFTLFLFNNPTKTFKNYYKFRYPINSQYGVRTARVEGKYQRIEHFVIPEGMAY